MSLKIALRQVVKRRRDALSRNERERKAIAIKERLFVLPEFRNAESVLFYAAFGSEVPTLKMMSESLGLGKKIILPITDTKTKNLALRRVHDLKNLQLNQYGIPEPVPESTVHHDYNEVDLVIVPGVVFDRYGQRIGYGGGYYDRFLNRIDPSVPRVSIAFEEQIVPEIPAESHDLPVDKIITEERVIDACKARLIPPP
ncbi:MAG: 5-formyltetrahydrofolate cyclo-ligase [Actinobacteria bacterium]|nr:5-formyltetrahydrofolate cyclo-ligase [Actinomycetota bacterium]